MTLSFYDAGLAGLRDGTIDPTETWWCWLVRADPAVATDRYTFDAAHTVNTDIGTAGANLASGTQLTGVAYTGGDFVSEVGRLTADTVTMAHLTGFETLTGPWVTGIIITGGGTTAFNGSLIAYMDFALEGIPHRSHPTLFTIEWDARGILYADGPETLFGTETVAAGPDYTVYAPAIRGAATSRTDYDWSVAELARYFLREHLADELAAQSMQPGIAVAAPEANAIDIVLDDDSAPAPQGYPHVRLVVLTGEDRNAVNVGRSRTTYSLELRCMVSGQAYNTGDRTTSAEGARQASILCRAVQCVLEGHLIGNRGIRDARILGRPRARKRSSKLPPTTIVNAATLRVVQRTYSARQEAERG